MTPFLKYVAEHFYGKGRNNLKDYCFIFPNRRAMAFFEKYLADKTRGESASGVNLKPIFLPEMTTVNDFMYKLYEGTPTDRVDQLLELYEVYKEENPTAEPLDDFIFWGDILLADFNDVDKYLIDPESLFVNVSDFKNIQSDMQDDLTENQKVAINALTNFMSHFKEQNVSFRTENQEEGQNGGPNQNYENSQDDSNLESLTKLNVKDKFQHVWDLLLPLYKKFNSRLREKGMNYEGMVYRAVSEEFGDEKLATDIMREVYPRTKKYVFIGLNALNECEKKVMSSLKNEGLAEFCWDYFSDIIKNNYNMSSYFMRQYLKPENFPQADFLVNSPVSKVYGTKVSNFNGTSNSANEKPKQKINVVSVPSAVGQTKLVPTILQNIADVKANETGMLYGDMSKIGSFQEDGVDCAIVTPDEGLLIPLLNTIPTEIKDINVTMGYPMSNSNFYSFMHTILELQMNIHEGNSFYYKPVWGLFSNSIFKKACLVSEQNMDFESEIKKEVKLYVECDKFNTPLLKKIFTPVINDKQSVDSKQIGNLCDYLISVIEFVAPLLAQDANMALELEFAKKYYNAINRLKDKELEIKPKTFVRLLNNLLNGLTVPFKGEPLKGLQIMGPLETRVLDFTNLIILSCNEGMFPRKSVSGSFIPPELRKGFGLPTYQFQDAVWAYYFYRMIQRAENIWLVFDSRATENEESRYIKQLQYHFSGREEFGNIEMNRMTVNSPISEQQESLEIPKTKEDVEVIKSSTLSASSMQNYLSCPVKFYYHTVKKLNRGDEVVEQMQMNHFGTVFHAVMQRLYSTGLGVKGHEIEKPQEIPNPIFNNHPAYLITMEYMKKIEAESQKNPLNEKTLNSPNYVMIMIKEEINELSDVSGANLIQAYIIYGYVRNLIQKDLKLMRDKGVTSFKLLGNEVKLYTDLHGLKYTGSIDRVDSFEDGVIRVIDYKTGSVSDEDILLKPDNSKKSEEEFLDSVLDKLFGKSNSSRPKIAFQVFIYDKLIEEAAKRKNITGYKVVNSIYSVLHFVRGDVQEVSEKKGFNEKLSLRLENLTKELLDVNVPFKRTEEANTCVYCDFKTICGR